MFSLRNLPNPSPNELEIQEDSGFEKDIQMTHNQSIIYLFIVAQFTICKSFESRLVDLHMITWFKKVFRNE